MKLSKLSLKRRLLRGGVIGIFVCLSPNLAIAQSSQAFTPYAPNISQDVSSNELIDIIEKSYDYHPDLLRVRAELDIIKEDISLARSAYRPQLTAQGSVSASERDSLLQNGDQFSQDTTPVSYTHLTLPTTPYV